jgi:PAS domain-containing protein
MPGEGIFQTTPEGKYLSANPALARMYGYDSQDLLADLGRQLYVESDRRRKLR